MLNLNTEYHDTILRIFFLIGIFLFGLFDKIVFKRKDWAYATWFLGLLAITAWIVYPMTTFRISLGLIFLIISTGILIICDKNSRYNKAESPAYPMPGMKVEVIEEFINKNGVVAGVVKYGEEQWQAILESNNSIKPKKGDYIEIVHRHGNTLYL